MINKVIEIAKEAGNILMKYYSKNIKVLTKEDSHDFLTKADIESDNYIRKALQKEFPRDSILSEENENTPLDYSGRVWMVDSLDGTKDFINKGTGFSVMIGLCENGKPILGVFYAPMCNLIYYAEEGKGAYVKKESVSSEIHVSSIEELQESRLITRFLHGEERPLDKMINNIQVKEKIPESSVGIKLGKIASGDAEIHINSNFRASKWDTCAPQIILEEAGGVITDFEGNTLDYKQPSLKWEKSFVASNNIKLHKKIIEEIKKHS